MKSKKFYRCQACGYESVSWTGKCPQCGAWGKIKEMQDQEERGTQSIGREETVLKLSAVTTDQHERVLSGISELDRVLGGGFVRDGVSVLTARPGAGKSTLLLEIARVLAERNMTVLYISGEESSAQIKQRALRIMPSIPDKIWIKSGISMDRAVEDICKIDPDVVFLDSIQTMVLSDLPSRAGSPVQTVECTAKLIALCKGERPRIGILVGHMTKQDEMAGLRTLEHMVDTVLYMEGESDVPLRVLVSTKNRFGPTGEIGLFQMQSDGLKEVKEAADVFLTKREHSVPGSALSVIKEGTRLMVVEVEALTSPSFTPYPQRIGDFLRKDQLNTLVSIVEERGGLRLYDRNIIMKTTGGIRITEPSVNLAVIMAIVSAYHNKPIPMKDAFIAEVGLTGELKKVPQIHQRIKELDRLGYRRVYTYPLAEPIETDQIEVIEIGEIKEVIRRVFQERN